MTTSNDATYQQVISSGTIASCSTCELLAIIEAHDLYQTLPIPEQGKGLVNFSGLKAVLQTILNGGSSITEEI
ncbi:hypothetical protein TNCV_669411 [Trichonephila clavipes]|nr:hypothetical protein TNCV_669411 [Trichonephila clavipes]